MRRLQRAVLRVMLRTVAAGAEVTVAVEAVVDPQVAAAGRRRLSGRAGFGHAVAGVAGDAGVIVVAVVEVVVVTLQQAAVGAVHDIVRCRQAGLAHAAAIPALRRVATQAPVADTGHVAVGDIERSPEQRVARRMRHHRAAPGIVRHVGLGRRAEDLAVAGRAGFRFLKPGTQARLGAVLGEILGEREDGCAQQPDAHPTLVQPSDHPPLSPIPRSIGEL